MLNVPVTFVPALLLLLSLSLVTVDAIVTKVGLKKGLHETNPILRWLLNFGTAGLASTRIAALVILLILFWFLDPCEWVLFGSTFSAVMGYVVFTDVRKIHAAMDSS